MSKIVNEYGAMSEEFIQGFLDSHEVKAFEDKIVRYARELTPEDIWILQAHLVGLVNANICEIIVRRGCDMRHAKREAEKGETNDPA